MNLAGQWSQQALFTSLGLRLLSLSSLLTNLKCCISPAGNNPEGLTSGLTGDISKHLLKIRKDALWWAQKLSALQSAKSESNGDLKAHFQDLLLFSHNIHKPMFIFLFQYIEEKHPIKSNPTKSWSESFMVLFPSCLPDPPPASFCVSVSLASLFCSDSLLRWSNPLLPWTPPLKVSSWDHPRRCGTVVHLSWKKACQNQTYRSQSRAADSPTSVVSAI